MEKAAAFLNVMYPDDDSQTSKESSYPKDFDSLPTIQMPAEPNSSEDPGSPDAPKTPESPEDFLRANKADLPLPGLTTFVADQIFGLDLDKKDEHLFLKAELDETDELQGELINKVRRMLTSHGYADPCAFTLHAYRRLAGFNGQMKTEDGMDLATPFAIAICLKDYVEITHEGKSHVLRSGQFSPMFHITEKQKPAGAKTTKKRPPKKTPEQKTKDLQRPYKEIKHFQGPSIKRDQTRVVLPGQNASGRIQGQTTIKPRDYLALVIWVFWDRYPMDLKEEQYNLDHLKTAMEEMRKNPPPGVSLEDLDDLEAKLMNPMRDPAEGADLMEL